MKQTPPDDGAEPGLPHVDCTLCSTIGDREESFYKAGVLESEAGISRALDDLVVVKDTTYGSRINQIRQCPRCETYYRYWTDYEFLTNGSEDEEFLVRLYPDEVRALGMGLPGDDAPVPELPEKTAVEPPQEALPTPPRVTLNNAQMQTLLKAFQSFEWARDRYKTGQAWSCDISIPSEALYAARDAMRESWVPLSAALTALQIHDVSFADIQVPRRFTGGRQRFASLLAWLEAGGHLVDPESL